MPTSLYRSSQRLIFSYPNSAPLGYTILTDETGGKVLNPLSSLVSFLTLSYSQDWHVHVCSRSSVVSGSSEASGEYVSQAMFIQVPIECRTGARGVGRNCRKGGLSLKGVKHWCEALETLRRKFGGVTGSHTSCLMTHKQEAALILPQQLFSAQCACKGIV